MVWVLRAVENFQRLNITQGEFSLEDRDWKTVELMELHCITDFISNDIVSFNRGHGPWDFVGKE